MWCENSGEANLPHPITGINFHWENTKNAKLAKNLLFGELPT
jgi:hypothetical protein